MVIYVLMWYSYVREAYQIDDKNNTEIKETQSYNSSITKNNIEYGEY